MSSRPLLPRIAMISTHGYVAANPPLGAADTGGQVVYVLELAKKLAQMGYMVDIWTRRFADQPDEEPVNGRVRVLRMPCGGDEFIAKEYLYESIPEWCENALHYIRAHELEYVFINSHYWDAGMAGQYLSEALSIPHIHTPHSLGMWKQRQMEQDYPGDAARFERQYNFSKRIKEEQRIYEDCQMVIATTPPQFDLLVREHALPPSKVKMIPPGYDDNRFFPVSAATRDAIRNQLGFAGKQVVLALGRLARNKGYDLLIEGFGLVAARAPTTVLHLAVGGTDMNAAEQSLLDSLKEQAARTPYADRIVFGSFIPDAQLSDYYRAADAFVLCSRYEPFGMTAIESMASGTPTVVTTHGGLYRALSFGRHALFADPFDREDLGITIAKIFRHERLRARLAHMGAYKARSLFTWTGVAQQLMATVDERPTPRLELDDRDQNDPWSDSE